MFSGTPTLSAHLGLHSSCRVWTALINTNKQTNKQTNNNNTELSVISVFPREVAENRAVDTVALVQVYLSVLLFFSQCHSTNAPHSVTYTHSTSAPHSQSPTRCSCQNDKQSKSAMLLGCLAALALNKCGPKLLTSKT